MPTNTSSCTCGENKQLGREEEERKDERISTCYLVISLDFFSTDGIHPVLSCTVNVPWLVALIKRMRMRYNSLETVLTVGRIPALPSKPRKPTSDFEAGRKAVDPPLSHLISLDSAC